MREKRIDTRCVPYRTYKTDVWCKYIWIFLRCGLRRGRFLGFIDLYMWYTYMYDAVTSGSENDTAYRMYVYVCVDSICDIIDKKIFTISTTFNKRIFTISFHVNFFPIFLFNNYYTVREKCKIQMRLIWDRKKYYFDRSLIIEYIIYLCGVFLTFLVFRNFRQSPTSALSTAAPEAIRRYMFWRRPGVQTGTRIADVANNAIPTSVTGYCNATPAWSWSATAYRSTPAAQSTEQANVIQG